MNPFALVNDAEGDFPVIVIDENLKNQKYWSFHPMDNAVSLEIKGADVQRIIEQELSKKVQFLALGDEAYANQEEQKNPKKPKKNKKKATKTDENAKGETKLKIFSDKETQFGDWYTEVIKKGDLIEYYDVSGCYILKHNSYCVWENVQRYLDDRFKSLGVQNVYFPMFLKKKHLESEKDHLEGFEAEVAWVTKSGKSDLAEPIAIRPTSETIMYPVFKKWIQSHRDLPMLFNQWTNVVRWEFSNPTPFIRTREFLWQEGHTVHLTNEDCTKFVLDILDIYADCYKEMMAIPVIKGKKSENEKFAGADFTTTCETYIAEAGRSVQACTSHNLGQNFARIFDISFEDKDNQTKKPWQASWGFSTRSIGAMVMVHSDNKGLVMPPRVAFKQVVIIPITFSKNTEIVMEKSEEIYQILKKAGLRVQLDDRDNYKPGWKYNDWELKGVPLRLEVGPKDIAKKQYRSVRRVDGKTFTISFDNLVEDTKKILEDAHQMMYDIALEKLVSKKGKASNWEEFMKELNKMKYVETPWCCEKGCEHDVKDKSAEETDESSQLSGKAKTLCLPFDSEAVPEGTVCFNCGKPAKKYTLWGRSY